MAGGELILLLCLPQLLSLLCLPQLLSLLCLPQLLSLLILSPSPSSAELDSETLGGTRNVIDVDGGPDSVAWVVQLSDLHFSVFHPERARDFMDLIGPTLAIVNPSLVLITGDLTDGKSKDLMTMKSNEEEWVEYRNVMEETIRRSGLERKIFYDLRGNHDNFGVPEIDGSYDFFKNYSINSGLNRNGNVHSVTLKNGRWKHLFVGFDATMDVGLRGPTNLFGHPSDDLLTSLDQELSQWDSDSDFKNRNLTKIAFGHFTISFSAPAESGRSLKDVFLNHSLSSYLCGHLHSRFGKNLKRRHVKSSDLFQLNIHQGGATATTPPMNPSSYKNCSGEYDFAEEFWEWEMGDWRKRRAFRIIAIDSGRVSYLDIDLKKKMKTIILPLFPLDSRFMQRISSGRDYFCELSKKTSTYQTVRALVFSEIKINMVIVRMFDSMYGSLDLVMDSTMNNKQTGNRNRGCLYSTLWNWRAFTDPSPDRYWMQIEAVDIHGTSTFSELRPFSINGLTAKVRWTWNEFRVMGIQWASLHHIVLRIILSILYSLVLIPRVFLFISDVSNMNIIQIFNRRKTLGFLVFQFFWVFLEFSKLTLIWHGTLVYLLFLTFFSWISGNIFTQTGVLGYLSLNGWSVGGSAYLGVPDIIVIVIPHLCLVVLPSLLVMSGLAAEKVSSRIRYLEFSGKKHDDDRRHHYNDGEKVKKKQPHRIFRKFLMLACLVILLIHFMLCRVIWKAYEVNPLVHSPVFCFTIPVLLVYTLFTTSKVL